jgi:hypothetical protein
MQMLILMPMPMPCGIIQDACLMLAGATTGVEIPGYLKDEEKKMQIR